MPNVVEVVVQATNATGPGFAAAKAGADETAASMDTLAAASDRVTAAQVKYAQTTGQLLDAQLQLAEVEGKEGATEAEIAAAKDKVTAATLRQADAQIALVNAEAKQETAAAAAADASVAGSEKAATAAKAQADATKAAGDAAVVSGAKSDEAGGLMAGMGAKLKVAAAAVVIGMGAAVDQAAKFQDSTTHLVTDAGEAASKLGMVQQGILAVSASTGTSASQITDAMYHIESGGFHAANGLAILKTVAEGAKVGGADLDTTSKALIGTLTAYYGTSMTAAQATQRSTSLMNQLITTVGSGDMRMQDLAAAIHSVAPVAAAAGISFAQVGGAIATMTAQGMSADQVTQDLGHVIGSLASPTNVMAVEMKAMGLNANEVAKNLGKTGLSGTIDQLRDAVLRHTQGGSVMLNMLKGMSPAAQDLANKILAGTISTHDLTSAMKELNPQQYTLVSHFKSAAVSVTGMQQTYTAAMSKMLGGQMGLNVGLMLTGKHMDDVKTATDNIAAAGAKASTTVDNWSTIQGTFKFKMDQTKASLQDTGIALGSALLPAVTAILGPLAHFLSVIAGNKDAAIAFAVVIGGVLAGAIGTKAVKAVTEFKSAVETTVGGISKLVKAIGGIGGAQDAAAAETEAAAGEQEAAAGEVAAANDEAAAESSGSWVASAARAVAAGAVWVAQSVAKVAVVVASHVAGAAVTVASWVAAAAAQVASGVMWVAGTIAKVAVVVGANVAGALATAAAWVVANGVMLLGIGLVVAAVALAVYEIVTHWKSIVHGVEEAWDAVYHAVSVAVSAVVDFVKSHWMLLLGILLGPIALAVALIATYWKQISSFTEGLWHDVSGFVSRLASDVFGFFEKMASDVTGAERKMISDVIADVRQWFSDFVSVEQSGLTNIVHWFEGLPGRILSGLGNIGSLLVSAGENIIIGLYNGIVNEFNSLISGITSIGSSIANAFKGALGIGSPSKVFHGFGLNITQGLANGLDAGQPQVHSAMTRMAGNVTAGGYGGLAVAGAGGTVTHQVQLTIDNSSGDQFIRWLRQSIRTKGGNVQAVLGAG